MISPILAFVFVAATTIAMPGSPTETKPSTARELVASVYGPLSSWEPIRLIDAFPDALVDGKPANSSVLLGYRAPALTTAEQRSRAQELLFSRGRTVRKRDDFGCYGSGRYVRMLPPTCSLSSISLPFSFFFPSFLLPPTFLFEPFDYLLITVSAIPASERWGGVLQQADRQSRESG
jgi:hypothetical protein